MNKSKLLTFNIQELENSANIFNEEPYKSYDNFLIKLFNQIPNNKNIADVTAKVLAVDYIYSTRLKTTLNKGVSLCNLIEEITKIENLDEMIKNGDVHAVESILKIPDKVLFSFASKYCHLHNRILYNRDDFSIYDSVIHKLLPHYAGKCSLTYSQIEKWRKAKDYRSYNEAIELFLNDNQIIINNCRQKLDSFLWSQRRLIYGGKV